MSRIECVFFDLGGVLYTLDYEAVWRGFSECCGMPSEEVQSAIYSDGTLIEFETGKISPIQFYEAIKRRLGFGAGFDEFKKIFNSILIKRDDMFGLVSDLSNFVNVLILSNTNEINAEVLNVDLRDLDGDVVYSFEVGYTKPDQRIFRFALEKKSLTPEKTIFIDDLEENIRAARLLGIHTHLYKDRDSLMRFFNDYGIIDRL
ncbi:MAG: HAD family phosphatase [Spirochaetes bacterium]|nr:HAD family phosphatase [Spirochaetota bacterium]